MNIQDTDRWFLELLAIVLAGYFLWSFKGILSDFKDEVKGLKELIGKLFDKDTDKEKRLSFLEGKCRMNHPE